jgi:hypothetical protein
MEIHAQQIGIGFKNDATPAFPRLAIPEADRGIGTASTEQIALGAKSKGLNPRVIPLETMQATPSG